MKEQLELPMAVSLQNSRADTASYAAVTEALEKMEKGRLINLSLLPMMVFGTILIFLVVEPLSPTLASYAVLGGFASSLLLFGYAVWIQTAAMRVMALSQDRRTLGTLLEIHFGQFNGYTPLPSDQNDRALRALLRRLEPEDIETLTDRQRRLLAQCQRRGE